jgi:hypothetical protein
VPCVRALLATAGLFVLAGSAAAGSPIAHTLRKSTTGPIEAVAQDGSSAAWFTYGGKQGCDEIHVLTPGKPDRSLPQSGPESMTCSWDLTQGQSQLAFAARISTALWTLHGSGPSPFDAVVAAQVGGPERQIARLAHASDGTGLWLGSVAGSGKTLAYSWNDAEYVDKLACLSGGSCRRKIADGGITIVTQTAKTPLPTVGPALQLAASPGRIAYVPATRVPANRPSASTDGSVFVVDSATGAPLGSAAVHGIPAAIAVSSHVLAVLTQRGPKDRISWFPATGGPKLGSVLVSRRAAPQLATSDQLIVYQVDRTLYGVSTVNGSIRVLTKTAPTAVGLSLANGRLVWAENRADGGRLRALAAG